MVLLCLFNCLSKTRRPIAMILFLFVWILFNLGNSENFIKICSVVYEIWNVENLKIINARIRLHLRFLIMYLFQTNYG